ncbi:MAG: phosphoribosylglycinamide formyltransferase [Clostridia bacterium]|nr:phosphoribosylglycinamide formyltransferase [Candidatus Pelethousia sp.]NCB31196.1 phosphoribosylglycinamide formyltransferase [Clostridia bacterium]
MLKQRIAVLVSGGGTNLQALVDAQHSGVLRNGEIVLVLSSKSDAYGLKRARRAGIPAIAVDRSAYAEREDFEAELLKCLNEGRIDLIILAGFMQILSAQFVSRYPGRIINVHPSLIPAYCGKGFYGLKVHEAVLAAGEKVTGATVHLVNEIPDGGSILLQASVAVLPGDTPEVLQRRVMEQAEWRLLPAAAELVCKRLSTQRQEGETIHGTF